MSRKLKQVISCQSFSPISDVRDGIIVTKDGKFVKLMEFSPINYGLRSNEDTVLSLAAAIVLLASLYSIVMARADFPADTANAVCFVVVVFALYQPLLMHFGGNRLDDILSLIRQANRNAVSVHQNDTNHVGAGK